MSTSPLTLISLYHAGDINIPLRDEETEQQEAKMLHGQVQKGQPLLTPQKGDRSQCRDSDSAVRQ